MGGKQKDIGEVWLTSDLSTYLACFVALFARHVCFYFVGKLIVSFAIDRAGSRGADIAISYFV